MPERSKELEEELSEQERVKPGAGVCGGRLPPSGGQAALYGRACASGCSMLCWLPAVRFGASPFPSVSLRVLVSNTELMMVL